MANEHPSALEQLAPALTRALEAVAEDYQARGRQHRNEIVWSAIKWSGIALIVLGTLGYYAFLQASLFGLKPRPTRDIVAVVPIDGIIAPGLKASADRVNGALTDAFEEEHVQAVVLHINSPGGSASESERIAQHLQHLRAQTGKPVMAVIGSVGASAAYMIAVHTDSIHANRYALVGSIGAILKGWDLRGAADKVGLKERAFASGDLKNLLSPFDELNQRQASVLQNLVDEAAGAFISAVKERRGGKLRAEADGELFSGRVWSTERALELGLVDGIGTLEGVIRAEFGLPFERYQPTRSVMEQLGVSSMVDNLAARYQLSVGGFWLGQ